LWSGPLTERAAVDLASGITDAAPAGGAIHVARIPVAIAVPIASPVVAVVSAGVRRGVRCPVGRGAGGAILSGGATEPSIIQMNGLTFTRAGTLIVLVGNTVLGLV